MEGVAITFPVTIGVGSQRACEGGCLEGPSLIVSVGKFLRAFLTFLGNLGLLDDTEKREDESEAYTSFVTSAIYLPELILSL